jgi:translation initiation factor IF-3
VRVISDENGQRLSTVMSINEALQLADSLAVDLVEVTPNANPPICRVVEYGKFLYELKKKEKENSKKSQQQEVKELRLTPHTDEHDFEFKLKHAEAWLKKGDKVKATVFFKGREIVYQDQGRVLLLKLADTLKDISKAESLPILMGKRMSITISPK